MFHAASMGGIIGIPATGGSSVFVPLFEPQQVMDAIADQQVDWTTMVPTMIALVMNHPDFRPERLDSLRDLVYGASPMPSALLERLIANFPDLNLWQGYGMTECSSVLTFLTADDHRRGGSILRSAGRAGLGIGISVRRHDDTVAAAGENGEICARGGNFMTEYWKQPAATARAFEGGWYRTGDEGHLDSEGYLYLVDRIKDMIVSGGENVYSIEVENAITTHPAVAQVAVIGIPHPVWVEQVHTIVVLRAGLAATEEQIKEHVRGMIAGFKVPKSVEFRSEPIPLSGALKPLKRELREPFWRTPADVGPDDAAGPPPRIDRDT